jgi:hypothetical protein
MSEKFKPLAFSLKRRVGNKDYYFERSYNGWYWYWDDEDGAADASPTHGPFATAEDAWAHFIVTDRDDT